AMLEELEGLIGDDAAALGPLGEDDDDDFGFVPVQMTVEDDAAAPEPMAAPAGASWRIEFQPKTEMYAKANETGLVLRELARLGEVIVELDEAEVPPLDQLHAEQAYMSWAVTLTTEADEAAIRDVFEFVEDDCDLAITCLGESPALDPGFEDEPPARPQVDGFDPNDILSRLTAEVGVAPEPEPETLPEASPPALAAAPPAEGLDVAGLIALAQKASADSEPAAPPAAAAPAPAVPAAAQGAQAAPTATIRVDLDRVDRLINAVGELVIQQAMLSQRVVESGLARSSSVALGLEDLEMLTREIQDSVMAIRAQPVRSVFQRMPRLVRECSEMTGKKVRLAMEGESTEVDKTVIERLSDPITHMLRNAIDHGLETPQERLAAGKPEEGAVRLAALHRGGRIVIEVQDDGRGINREKVKGKAIANGLISEDAVLTDDEIDNLIFLPGFSTADAVSDLSGRGVGMDVVKRSVVGLGGRISISSEPGKGSKFTMSLPLTLAVLDGMVVTSAEQTLVAPLSNIVESLTPKAGDVHFIGGQDAVIRIRDTFVPLIEVAGALGFGDGQIRPDEQVAILVEAEGGAKAALLVDAIQGQRQVVIKSLESNYQHIDGIAAATILGDGRVALILDVDALVSSSRRKAPREKRMAS
ncbi:MAG: chemotaxis protein CheA, partial [Phenylobacterium sp.]